MVGIEEEEDELLRAAEELGIDLSGVRAYQDAAADEQVSEESGERASADAAEEEEAKAET